MGRIIAIVLGLAGVGGLAFGLFMLAVLPRFQGMGAGSEVFTLPLVIMTGGGGLLVGAYAFWRNDADRPAS